MEKGVLEKKDSELIQNIFDNDSSIEYEGAWVLNKFNDTSNNPPQMETSHSTAQPGSFMVVNFHGVQILVSGTIPAGDGAISASYTIDNSQKTLKTVSATQQDDLHETLFQSPLLADGPHNLTVEVLETGSRRNYTFQQFKVTKGGHGTDVANSTSQSATSLGMNDGHGSSAAVIVGVVLGIVIALLLAFILVSCFQKRRSTQISDDTDTERHRPAMMYYAHPVSDGYQYKRGHPDDLPSVIDTDSKFTFALRKGTSKGSRPSWVSVNVPPNVPKSFLALERDLSDWSTYKGSGMIIRPAQAQMEMERSQLDTSTMLSSIAFQEPSPQLAPRGTGSMQPL